MYINLPGEKPHREYLIAVLTDHYRGLSRSDAEELADREGAEVFVEKIRRGEDPAPTPAPKRADSRRVYRDDGPRSPSRGGTW